MQQQRLTDESDNEAEYEGPHNETGVPRVVFTHQYHSQEHENDSLTRSAEGKKEDRVTKVNARPSKKKSCPLWTLYLSITSHAHTAWISFSLCKSSYPAYRLQIFRKTLDSNCRKDTCKTIWKIWVIAGSTFI